MDKATFAHVPPHRTPRHISKIRRSVRSRALPKVACAFLTGLRCSAGCSCMLGQSPRKMLASCPRKACRTCRACPLAARVIARAMYLPQACLARPRRVIPRLPCPCPCHHLAKSSQACLALAPLDCAIAYASHPTPALHLIMLDHAIT
ncbi:hypothetical protein HAX54_025048 [Datura stramonium]|uniref:Uncharacterized protein n=1 Tax=Datura stramonium TaxID=4076 RepID=A0ABS8V1S6_DATST|nr:hypothetical protein [Datura stramonium]